MKRRRPVFRTLVPTGPALLRFSKAVLTFWAEAERGSGGVGIKYNTPAPFPQVGIKQAYSCSDCLRARVRSIAYGPHGADKQVKLSPSKIADLSKMTAFEYEKDGIRMWRSWEVGVGKKVPYKNLIPNDANEED
ncbi:hypothetical protein PRIPAC_75703 [Pristionchus pacificus]|uniref:Uncharacterized protein n=1 Tax=Pristionchus pacificus TaxID=54126 RepID=A0A2A6C8B6_PRIPA|nr:hypothetical protein PRIPAC_75703 [Pristionchus pacificus]|eukprot:PDM74318.1 hypothetical protein PRIPAC_41674 [Pristionchus pacificus]